MHKWNQAGYISSDAATTSDAQSWLKSKRYVTSNYIPATVGMSEKQTADDKVIDYLKGINGINTVYTNSLGIYGDKREVYMFVLQ